ncbi:MAG: hypothetical protein EON98_05635 [Chitinophagaceae bacterium]|nr:MAG: hypothetical protein EON98_05635 [Chitinophagaceae bacterium]
MTSVSLTYADFNSILSLNPLVKVLRKMIAEEKPGAKKLYQQILTDAEAVPELLEPIQDVTLLKQHSELVEALLGSIFPPSTSSNQGFYAITYPFSSETIYASPGFRNIFLKDGTNINVPDRRTTVDISRASLLLAYHVILKRCFSLQVPITTTTVHPFTEEDGGLTKYYELRLNAEFVDVVCVDEKISLPEGFSPTHTLSLEELQELFPLDNFQFEGLVVINVSDVTSEQVTSEIKTALLNINAFSEAEVFEDLQAHMQSLIGLRNVKIGITPLFKKNDYYLYTETHYRNSLLFKNPEVIEKKDEVSHLCQRIFRTETEPVLYENLERTNGHYNELVRYYLQLGAKSLLLCPLQYKNGGLIGLLEIMGEQPGELNYAHLSAITPAIELFRLALEKTADSLEAQIDKTIKEHFTAIQPAVEWKFTEAAFQYLQHQNTDLVKMPQIAFQDVYPLYGAIDVRNSSLERTNSIQLDLLEQLTLANDVLSKACKVIDFPLLKETQFRIEKYMAAASDTLLSDDEMQIYDFLQIHLDSIFQNLLHLRPELKKLINGYFNALDSQRKVVYHHRKDYEDSITRINDVLDRFTDLEQRTIQEIYPHYFERYITDGVEFNIYVGQSLSPNKPFNEMYVRNLKLWQLSFLAKAARLTASLEKRLPLPLQTTQLILAHAIPLSISFRRKERKFDVDGAYNIRYEIIKKRIDKVHIRDSEERLTQPGKIAIVYSQHKELAEYLEYIEFLHNEGLLGENIEHLDLEDTQGISGLKAVRVDVCFNNEPTNTPQKEAYTKMINLRQV